MGKYSFLLPVGFKPVGIVFFVAGILAAFTRFYLGIKPKLLNMKVFAVYSEYLDDKYLKAVQNNLGEEVPIFLIISGLFLFAFTREKVESEIIQQIRYKSMIMSFYLGFAFLMAANFFTFGFAFVYMLIIYSGVPLLAFILLFQFHLYLYRKNNRQVAQPMGHENNL